MSSAVDGQQQQQQQQHMQSLQQAGGAAVGSPPMDAVQMKQCKVESPNGSPVHVQAVSAVMSPTAVHDMPPVSTSPVMLATMQPVSVDDFQSAEYHHHQHHHHQQHHHQQHQQQHPDDPLDQKTVIYIPGTDPQQTIIYDPQNPAGSLPPGITIQQDSGNGTAVSVLVQGQAGHQYLGAPGTTVLVMQELVDDMGHILNNGR